MVKFPKANWVIKWYEDHRGRRPAQDYISGLQPQEKAQVTRVLDLLGEFGTDLDLPHARRIQGKLWELRPGSNRLLYFLFKDNQFVILHAFRKTTRTTPDAEKAIARRRMKELLED